MAIRSSIDFILRRRQRLLLKQRFFASETLSSCVRAGLCKSLPHSIRERLHQCTAQHSPATARGHWEISQQSCVKYSRDPVMTMTYQLLILASVVLLSFAQLESADKPAPRTDRNSMIAHEELLEKRKKGRIDVYFLGDSITRRWGTSDEQYKKFLENWRQNFFGWNAANFGWGGETTQNILWRLENGELDGVNPKVIVILAGTNNVGRDPGDDAKVADITRGVHAVINLCRKKAPRATIILTAIFPRNDNLAVVPTINRINENIAAF